MSVQDRCIVCARCTIGLQIVLDDPMVPLDDDAYVEARFGLSDIELILTQDRCTVCVERIMGSEIVLDAPDGIKGDVGHVESRFFSGWRQC